MWPDDRHGSLPLVERPLRVLVLSGSNRRQLNCPGREGKARALMLRMARRLPAAWEVDYEDLGNLYERARIQSCNACVSTAGPLCVWPCNCYERHNAKEPDLMWDLDLYSRLDLADAWAIIGPLNWYAPTSNLKLMFDRMVCMNGGNPREDLIDHKDPEKAIALEKDPRWQELSVNHLEGRTAAFFCYGDRGGDELDDSGVPRQLQHREYFDPASEPFDDDRQAYAPLVWQCRYSGIEVPDALWCYGESGRGKPYSENQIEHMASDFILQFDDWVDSFSTFVAQKGKVPPGRWRAYGYKPPGHTIADLRLRWRALKTAIAGHNLHFRRSEGEKLRRPFRH